MTDEQAKEWIDRWMSAGGSWNDAQSLAQLVSALEEKLQLAKNALILCANWQGNEAAEFARGAAIDTLKRIK